MSQRYRSSSLAAVFHEPGIPLELKQFKLPALQSGEAIVEISCCTICGSDLHTMQGHRSVAGPTVLGHETIGKVAALPTDGPSICDVTGKPLAIGDRVTWAVAASCGDCFFCNNKLPQKCESLFKYGHETTDSSALSGGLAEFCHLQRGTAIVRVPDTLPDHVACPANCATATVAAAIRTADGCKGKTIVVHGAGMLGLTCAAMACDQGAVGVVVTDVCDDRLARASSFGASHFVNVSEDSSEVTRKLRSLTDGRGADIAFEMSGATSAIAASFDQLRTGGAMVLVGAVFPTPAVELLPEQVVRKLLRIEGVHNYTPSDLVTAVEFLTRASSAYPFASLVESELTLQEFSQATESLSTASPIRAAVRPK